MMRMMRFWCLILAAMLMISGVALANDAPAEGSRKLVYAPAINRDLWRTEDYPEVWLAPVPVEYIVNGQNPETYPESYMTFPVPQNAQPLTIEYGQVWLIDPTTKTTYTYTAQVGGTFEAFLAEAAAGTILHDGSDGDGLGLYYRKDAAVAIALIDMQELFGDDVKLMIQLEVFDYATTPEQTAALLQAEVMRVYGQIALAKPGRPWNQNVYTTVELVDGAEEVRVQIDTTDLTLISANINAHQLITMTSDGTDNWIEFEIGSYLDRDAKPATLADGTEYLLNSMRHTSYAFFPLQPGQYSANMYLEVAIKCMPEEAAQLMETVYPRIQFVTE